MQGLWSKETLIRELVFADSVLSVAAFQLDQQFTPSVAGRALFLTLC
jgi:hypothetical protein